MSINTLLTLYDIIVLPFAHTVYVQYFPSVILYIYIPLSAFYTTTSPSCVIEDDLYDY